jgi:nitrite reductase/ring-hydroxylating ferredoxin subunit
MSEFENLSRRQFVVLAAGCAAMCACGVGQVEADTSSTTVDVGAVTDYPQTGIYDQYIKSNKIVIYRENGQMYASTAICPHKGARMVVKGDQVYCPRHGSLFDDTGAVIKGPAEDSLERYAVSINDKNHLIVDKTKTFREKDWTDPASFVKVG